MSETFWIALQSIRGNLFRAALTMLGIIIGVAAVITMVALGTGAQRAIDEQMEALGGDILSIAAGSWFNRGVARDLRTLTTDDAAALAREVRHVDALVPEISERYQVKYGNRNINVNILGTTPNYPSVHGFDISLGQMFTAAHDSSRKRVAVIGNEVPGMLETDATGIIGRTIAIRSINFEVIGVLKAKGTTGWRNPDDDIWIPLRTAQFRVTGTDKVETISAKVASDSSVELDSRSQAIL
jgi:putative ABC transport system permease protein